jgi:hypothetical protein
MYDKLEGNEKGKVLTIPRLDTGNFPALANPDHDNPYSGQSASQTRLEPGASGIQISRVPPFS